MPKYGFIDLRNEMENLRDSVGFRWLALRTVNFTKPALEAKKPVPLNYDQTEPDNQNIVANEYFIDKLVKGFSYLSQPGFDFQTQVGPINTKLRVFILEHEKKPKNTDFILELNLNEDTGVPIQPFKVTRVWKIQDAEPMRAGQPTKKPTGRIDFFRCFAEESNLGYGPRFT